MRCMNGIKMFYYLALKGELCDKVGKYIQSLPSIKINLQSVGDETVMLRTKVKQPLKWVGLGELV